MKNMQTYEGIDFYPDISQKNKYYFIPAQPMPQTDSNGDPMISIIGGGANWFLQASAKWGAGAAKIEELTKRLQEQGLIHSPMDLSPAPLKVEKAELTLKTDKGEKILATSRSSGQYPFMAIFNTSVSEDLQNEIVAAFHGKKEALMVRYYATLALEYPVAMSLSGTIDVAGDYLNEGSSTYDIAIWLEEQIQKGSVTIDYEPDENAPTQLVEGVKKKLKDEAVIEIQRFLRPGKMTPDTSALKVRVEESITVPESIVAATDVSVWFINNPDDHIKVIA